MARAAVPDPHSQPVLPSYRLPATRRAMPMTQASDCVVALRALGEETRVRIVGLLMDHSRDVTEISNQLDVSPYNVSKHLRVLREAGLLEVEKDGRQRLYALPDAIRRQAAAGKVLDLGCCSFQFDAPAGEAAKSRSAQPPATRKRKTRR